MKLVKNIKLFVDLTDIYNEIGCLNQLVLRVLTVHEKCDYFAHKSLGFMY